MVAFWKCQSESYLITAMFKIRPQQLRGTLATVFWNTPFSWRFYRHRSRYVLIFSWTNFMKWKSKKAHEKLSVDQKLELALWTKLQQNRSWRFTNFYALFISTKNLIFKFNPVLIEYLLPQFIFLLPFDYHLIFCRSWRWSSATTLFYKNH